MSTLDKSAGVTSLGLAVAGLRIGLAALFGGLLLAFVLWMVNALVGKEASASVVRSLPVARSSPVVQSVDPPCGTLDGITIDPMEAVGDWYVMMGNGAVSATLATAVGYAGQAVQLKYNLGVTPGAWVQLRRDFDPPLDLSAGDHLRFFHQGTTTNTLEVGLVVSDTNYFATPWRKAAHVPWWAYITWDFRDFCMDDQLCPDVSQVQAIFISVKKSDEDDSGGFGSFTVDELQYLDIAGRDVPAGFEGVTAALTVTQQAAAWVADQWEDAGLLKSWHEESADFAWLYDQALGLIVLSETDPGRAKQLATTLHNLQNDDGSWYAGYHYNATSPISRTHWITTATPVGANAWTVYSLVYYFWKSGDTMAYQDALEGATWLSDLQRADGSLPALPGETTAPTEPNLDAWWAFQATGYRTQAIRLQNFLMSKVWDSGMGRFKASPDSYQIFLDNQTWGAAFLQAVGREEDARKALSYARWTLAAASSDGLICGFDGAGPFSVWNEGTLQYIAAQGENSRYYWDQVVRQQASDGGLPGSPDTFQGHTVWLARWHGIAPTSWLYFAGTCGPFPHPRCRIYLPTLLKNFGP